MLSVLCKKIFGFGRERGEARFLLGMDPCLMEGYNPELDWEGYWPYRQVQALKGIESEVQQIRKELEGLKESLEGLREAKIHFSDIAAGLSRIIELAEKQEARLQQR